MPWTTILERIPVKLLSYAAVAFIATWVVFVGIILVSYLKGEGIKFGNFGTIQVVKAGSSSLPTGAVIAFDLAKCPDDWENVGSVEADRFAGRTLVVAGAGMNRADGRLTTERKHGASGGSETILITKDQLPSHSHRLGIITSGKEHPNFGLNPNAGPNDFKERAIVKAREAAELSTVEEATQSKTIDNMPPFIALHFCKKKAS